MTIQNSSKNKPKPNSKLNPKSKPKPKSIANTPKHTNTKKCKRSNCTIIRNTKLKRIRQTGRRTQKGGQKYIAEPGGDISVDSAVNVQYPKKVDNASTDEKQKYENDKLTIVKKMIISALDNVEDDTSYDITNITPIYKFTNSDNKYSGIKPSNARLTFGPNGNYKPINVEYSQSDAQDIDSIYNKLHSKISNKLCLLPSEAVLFTINGNAITMLGYSGVADSLTNSTENSNEDRKCAVKQLRYIKLTLNKYGNTVKLPTISEVFSSFGDDVTRIYLVESMAKAAVVNKTKTQNLHTENVNSVVKKKIICDEKITILKNTLEKLNITNDTQTDAIITDIVAILEPHSITSSA